MTDKRKGDHVRREPMQSRKLVVTGVVNHLDNSFVGDKDNGSVGHHSEEVC